MRPQAKARSAEPTQRWPKRAARILAVLAGRGSRGERRGSGVRASVRGTRRAVALVPFAALALVFVLPLTSAFAAEAPQFRGELKEEEVYSTRAHIEAQANISNTESLEVHWWGEIATSEAGPWKTVGEETVPKSGGLLDMVLGEKSVAVNATILHKLEANTTYYARFHIEDAYGKAEKTFTFRTSAVAAPEVAKADGRNGRVTSFREECKEVPTPTSACFTAQIESNGAVTAYSFEYTTEPGNSGSWKPFTSGATGTISVAEDFANPEARLTGLTPETTYYVRLRASNKEGAVEQATYNVPGGFQLSSFATPPARPFVPTPEVSAVTGVSAAVKGELVPHSLETHWRFEYATAPAGPWANGPEGTVSQAEAEALPENVSPPNIVGSLTGLKPATTYYVKLFAENSAGEGENCSLQLQTNSYVCKPVSTASFETAGPPVVATLATHGVHDGSLRLLGSVNPNGYDTRFYFEYVSQRQFEEGGAGGGFARASVTAEQDMGTGSSLVYVGEDLPVLPAGESYRYRIAAVNGSPGGGVMRGGEQVLSVPVAPAAGGEEACPNQTLRVGASAALPDCRAYEQVTPVDKEGAQEIFRWANGLQLAAFALVGEDGDHVMVQAPVALGSGPSAGESPYFFSRDPAKGWQMTAATVQPEAGLDEYHAQVFDSNLTRVGFEAGWDTLGVGGSPSVDFGVGAPGGPYTTVASVPRKQVGEGGWVAGSEDASKLILEVEDRGLVEPRTTTKSGFDLYEYSAGSLRQVNVGVGKCGARIVEGNEESPFNETAPTVSSSHAVSADGSRVFFEAVPGSDCSEPEHLFVRVNGVETVDLGAYRFAGANAEGTEVLLERTSGEGQGLYLYRAGSAPEFLASTGLAEPSNFRVSQDLSTIYFDAGGQISHYDIASQALDFVASANQTEFTEHMSADGRYYYFDSASVGGVPGGAVVPGSGHQVNHKFGPPGPTSQVYRYDSVERAIECMSCSSAFAREPKLGSYFSGNAASSSPAGTPRLVFASDNGEFAFFQSTAALVASDIDGEVAPEGTQGAGATAPENPENENSVSGDVYEWRRDGSHGCTQVEGCLALITNGGGGYLNELLGTANEGRDVFIYTSSQLVSQDNDTAGDIYDVRVDGGIPGPARQVECVGDSCSTPFAAPSDLTPSSATFLGAGNVVSTPASAKSVTKTKTKAKPRCGAKGKRGCRAKPRVVKRGRRAGRAAAGVRASGGRGR